MQCPNDATVLVMSERSGIEIDYCPTCRGVWLDRGELDKIIERDAREFSTAQQQAITTTARFMACETAERNPGRNDRFEIGSIDRKFGMRRMACTRFQLCSFVPETIACLLRKQHFSYGVERLTRAKSPTAPLAN